MRKTLNIFFWLNKTLIFPFFRTHKSAGANQLDSPDVFFVDLKLKSIPWNVDIGPTLGRHCVPRDPILLKEMIRRHERLGDVCRRVVNVVALEKCDDDGHGRFPGPPEE